MSVSIASDYVYLDYAATAPLCEEAAEAMALFQVPGRVNLNVGANANSLHSPGRAAFELMEDARRSIAHDLGVRRPDEIIFTSGATEADDTAIIGLSLAAVDERQRAGKPVNEPHIIISDIEHSAVSAPADYLKSRGFRITRLKPDRQGFIEAHKLEEAIDEDTVLVSVQAVNSELGSVQPIAQMAQIAHHHGVVFHSDTTQALGKMPLDLGELDVDAASFSAHKIGGPKGVGALYLRARTPLKPLMMGGGQEQARRSGTQNVAAICGFAAASRAVVFMQEDESKRLRALRDFLYARLQDFPEIEATVEVETASRDFLPHIVHVLVAGFESETLVLRYDMLGFGVSGGSACASHSLEPSRVLTSIGIARDKALGALRISMGRYTTQEDIHGFLNATERVLHWS